MIGKRLTAMLLCITIILVLAGCKNNSLDTAENARLMASYTQALIDFDKTALTGLTAWETTVITKSSTRRSGR